MNKEKLEQLKEEISKMTKAEQIRQLEWSDHHEFSYGYAYYLLEENQQLEKIINKAIEFIKTEYNTFPSAEEWRKALLEILKDEN